MTADDVLVVGGGFAGFWAALAARRVLGPLPRVTLVSELPVLQLRPCLYQAQPEDLAVPLQPLLQRCGIRFVQASVQAIDAAGSLVQLADGPRRWRRLVLASGSQMPRPPVPGAEAAFAIDTQAQAVAFDRHLRQVALAQAHPMLAVVGAGFTGIELALELRHRIAAHAGADRAAASRVLLIDRAAVVGAELGPGPRPAIERALDQARVEWHGNAALDRITPQALHLRGQAPLAVHATVLCTGLRAAPLAAQLPGSHDALGRVVVDEHLRVPQAPTVLVCGDAAAADTGGGRLALQSCQHALRMGRFAGENAARDLQGLPLLTYGHARYVTCLDLGPAGAVYTEGWQREPRVVGADAKAIKRRINGQVIVPPLQASAHELLALSALADLPEAA